MSEPMSTEAQVARARLYAERHRALSEAGQLQAGIEAALQAVRCYRALVPDAPNAHAHDFVDLLDSLAFDLRACGRRDEALDVSREEVSLYQRWVDDAPVFRPDLTNALLNLSKDTRDLGRQRALEPLRMCIEAARQVVVDDPSTRQALVEASWLLCAELIHLEQCDDALDAARGAIAQHRLLAEEQAGETLADLAQRLLDLSNDFNQLDRHESALSVTREAVALYRELAASEPETFEPDLVGTLHNLCIDLRNLQRRAEALEPGREVVDRYRALVVQRGDTFRPSLATALQSAAEDLRATGRLEEACEAGGEAIELFRQLAVKAPGAFDAVLGDALSEMGADLWRLGRIAEATEASRAAVARYRRVLESDPVVATGLVDALRQLGELLDVQGRRGEAADCLGEARALERLIADAES